MSSSLRSSFAVRVALAAWLSWLGACRSGQMEDAMSDAAVAAAADADVGAPPDETPPAMDLSLHLHHVHMNVADRARTSAFYEQFFAAKRVELNGTDEALQVEPVLLLLEQRAMPPSSKLPTSLQHIGWGSADPAAWYEAAHARGVAPDVRGFTLFNTSETPTLGTPGSGALFSALIGVEPPACFPIPDAFSYIYVLGPDQERIEVWTGADRRINHLHFTTADVAASTQWFQGFLGLGGIDGVVNAETFFLDDILFFFEPIGVAADYEPTDDHVLGHVAFSVSDLPGWLARAREQGIEVVHEPATAHGFTSFFVRGPDGLLVELVQAAPLPALCPG
jgi:catechol 2,3-dioxygenase-like lactoylglutathione lyase family enzyme